MQLALTVLLHWLKLFAETYMNKGEPVFIEIQAPFFCRHQSSKNGSADLVSLRDLKEVKRKTADLKEPVIVSVTVSQLANPNNEAFALTAEQITSIYKATSLTERYVGGADKPIVAITVILHLVHVVHSKTSWNLRRRLATRKYRLSLNVLKLQPKR